MNLIPTNFENNGVYRTAAVLIKLDGWFLLFYKDQLGEILGNRQCGTGLGRFETNDQNPSTGNSVSRRNFVFCNGRWQ
jgi:hypothetical protein